MQGIYISCIQYVLTIGRDLMKKISRKAQRKMAANAVRGKWYNLMQPDEIPMFAAWLSNDFHEWQMQSPDTGEAMRAYKNGRTITIRYDGRRTICGRCVMALWYTYQCFKE